MGQPLGLLDEPPRVEALDRLENPGVQGTPPLVEQALVGHVVHQRVTEAVDEIGEERALIEQARGVELIEVEGVGHHVLAERPEWMTQKITGWLAKS